jgi:hypothetical protein
MYRAGIAVLAILALQPPDGSVFVVPSSPDLTIRTRTQMGRGRALETTLRFKGARQLSQHRIAGEAGFDGPHITQCDQRRMVILNTPARIYATVPLEAPGGRRLSRAVRVEGSTETRSSTHHITIDAVDTGERRTFGGLTARHVITTTTESSSDPGRTSTRVEDGWYVDLPPSDCLDRGETTAVLTTIATNGNERSIPTITWLGRARRGFPLMAQTRTRTADETWTATVELVEISNQPIDAAVFDIPKGFSPALPLGGGGFDITRPDTLVNRARLLWEQARQFASRLGW